MDEGAAARLSGADQCDNPYQSGSDEHFDWLLGWYCQEMPLDPDSSDGCLGCGPRLAILL
jgi:hypothetical protein